MAKRTQSQATAGESATLDDVVAELRAIREVLERSERHALATARASVSLKRDARVYLEAIMRLGEEAEEVERKNDESYESAEL